MRDRIREDNDIIAIRPFDAFQGGCPEAAQSNVGAASRMQARGGPDSFSCLARGPIGSHYVVFEAAWRFRSEMVVVKPAFIRSFDSSPEICGPPLKGHAGKKLPFTQNLWGSPCWVRASATAVPIRSKDHSCIESSACRVACF